MALRGWRLQLLEQRRRDALFDDLDGFAGGIEQTGETEIFWGDGACVAEIEDELPEVFPEPGAKQDQREGTDLAALDEGSGFEHLVERAESAGEADEGAGVLDEHHLAGEE